MGPDTSFLLAEVIASAIDTELVQSVGELKGTRYIDDYHLYFGSVADAEGALAELHRVAGQFQIDINDLKTGHSGPSRSDRAALEDVAESHIHR